MPPATIVAAAPQNAAWKSQNASSGMSAPLSAPTRNQPLRPMNAFPSPNMIAYPNMKNPIDAMQKSRKFFVRIFVVFFARMNPASTMPNPACIKKTRNAATSTHSVSMPTLMSRSVRSWAKTAVAPQSNSPTAANVRFTSAPLE